MSIICAVLWRYAPFQGNSVRVGLLIGFIISVRISILSVVNEEFVHERFFVEVALNHLYSRKIYIWSSVHIVVSATFKLFETIM